MQEPRDQDLILYYYGEARDSDRIRRQIDASPTNQKRYDELCRMLELVASQPVPEPWDDYDARVWRRLEPRLAERSGGRRARGWTLAAWLAPRRLASFASVTALVALAFAAGRFWPVVHDDASLSAASRERILLVSVGEHLERTEMLLLELANAPADGGDLSAELRLAEELLPFNRLYRQAARQSGQASVAEVLDELERLLLDVAHSDALTAGDLGDLRQRIEGGGILFRVQVVGSRVEQQHRFQKPHRSPDASGEA